MISANMDPIFYWNDLKLPSTIHSEAYQDTGHKASKAGHKLTGTTIEKWIICSAQQLRYWLNSLYSTLETLGSLPHSSSQFQLPANVHAKVYISNTATEAAGAGARTWAIDTARRDLSCHSPVPCCILQAFGQGTNRW